MAYAIGDFELLSIKAMQKNRMLLGYAPDFDVFDHAADPKPIRPESEASVLHRDHTEEATSLLAVVSGPALPALLAQLVRHTAHQAGRAIAPAVQGELVRLLGRAARMVLPDRAAPAGHLLGVELEGLSPEDQEFEAARRFVQWAEAAARHAALASPHWPPAMTAALAAANAARRFAPGLHAALRLPLGTAVSKHRSPRIAPGGSRPFPFQGAHHA